MKIPNDDKNVPHGHFQHKKCLCGAKSRLKTYILNFNGRQGRPQFGELLRDSTRIRAVDAGWRRLLSAAFRAFRTTRRTTCLRNTGFFLSNSTASRRNGTFVRSHGWTAGRFSVDGPIGAFVVTAVVSSSVVIFTRIELAQDFLFVFQLDFEKFLFGPTTLPAVFPVANEKLEAESIDLHAGLEANAQITVIHFVLVDVRVK